MMDALTRGPPFGSCRERDVGREAVSKGGQSMRKFLAAAFVTAAMLAPQAASAQAMAGMWSGIVTQTFTDGRQVSFTAMVSFTPGGSVLIAYPSDSCGGTLEPIAMKGTPTYRENITYGRDICADGGTVTLTLAGNALEYHWMSQGNGEATGTLRPTDKALPPGHPQAG